MYIIIAGGSTDLFETSRNVFGVTLCRFSNNTFLGSGIFNVSFVESISFSFFLYIPKRDICIIPKWYNKVKRIFQKNRKKEKRMEFRLKELRKRRRVSQLKLALDLNMNQNTISRYENMERQADYETLCRFADYFDVSLDYLLGRTDGSANL